MSNGISPKRASLIEAAPQGTATREREALPASGIHSICEPHEIKSADAESEPPLVLFVCRNNAAASILAEAILRQLARGHIRAASAGDRRSRRVSPYALECLAAKNIDTTGLHSKAWGRFFGRARPPVHTLITLCDAYAAHVNWDRDGTRTVKAHWPMPDPEAVAGSQTDSRLAFEKAFALLQGRIRRLLELPLTRAGYASLTEQLARIGEMP